MSAGRERHGGRHAENDDARGSRRAPRRSGGPAMFGLTMVLLVVAGALVLFMMTNKKPAVEAAPEAPVDPFADLPPEEPPPKQAKTKGELQREEQPTGETGEH